MKELRYIRKQRKGKTSDLGWISAFINLVRDYDLKRKKNESLNVICLTSPGTLQRITNFTLQNSPNSDSHGKTKFEQGSPLGLWLQYVRPITAAIPALIPTPVAVIVKSKARCKPVINPSRGQ